MQHIKVVIFHSAAVADKNPNWRGGEVRCFLDRSTTCRNQKVPVLVKRFRNQKVSVELLDMRVNRLRGA